MTTNIIVGKKEFIFVAFNLKDKIFVIHIAFLANLDSDIYSFQQTLLASLFVNKALTVICSKYTNFKNVYSLELVAKFFKHIGINNHPFDLVDS